MAMAKDNAKIAMQIRGGIGRRLLPAVLTFSLFGCAAQQTGVSSHESLNATLWTQSAAEYQGNTLQAYQLAADNMERALADPQWSAALEQTGDYADLPAAIMLDLDQTVLDTSSYNARIILQYGEHSSKRFREWCQQSAAPAIPGVKDFLQHAAERGVAIFYYSARREALRECTTRNLRAHDLPLPDQSRLLLNDGTEAGSKASQRANLAKQFRILLLVGDNLDDFVSGSKTDAAARRALAMQHAQRWGRQWIILPNPMYGDWESSLYAFDYSLPRDRQLQFKLQQLEQ
jgi:5'-nucleotidase (lipoprotein e(P4) family)